MKRIHLPWSDIEWLFKLHRIKDTTWIGSLLFCFAFVFVSCLIETYKLLASCSTIRKRSWVDHFIWVKISFLSTCRNQQCRIPKITNNCIGEGYMRVIWGWGLYIELILCFFPESENKTMRTPLRNAYWIYIYNTCCNVLFQMFRMVILRYYFPVINKILFFYFLE